MQDPESQPRTRSKRKEPRRASAHLSHALEISSDHLLHTLLCAPMGPETLLGPVPIKSTHHDSPQSQNLYAYPSKQVALEKAKELGRHGVHAMGSLWMPCEKHP